MFRSVTVFAALGATFFWSSAALAKEVPRQGGAKTGAGHHYIIQPRSSRVTTRGHARTGHVPSGAAGHSYAHSTFSQPTPIHGTFAAPRLW